MATAITYQSGPRKSDLRTVLVDDMRNTVVLLPTGRLDVVVGKLLHGTACRHEFWDEALGTSGDDFVIEASQVNAIRDMQVAVKVRVHK